MTNPHNLGSIFWNPGPCIRSFNLGKSVIYRYSLTLLPGKPREWLLPTRLSKLDSGGAH